MRKKKLIGTLLVLIFLLVLVTGWSNWNGRLYDYDQETFDKTAEQLAFKAKIPTKMPFDKMEVSKRDLQINKENLTVTLSNANKEYIGVFIGVTEPEAMESISKQEVNIGKNQGVYLSDVDGKRILAWQENEVYYQITFYYKLTPKEVSKKQLIKMAETFTRVLES